MSSTAATIEQDVAVATITTPRGVAAAVAAQAVPVATIGAVQGIAGRPGVSASAPSAYAITGAASFTANHGLPFAPEAWILTPDGEVIEADVLHAPGATTIVFPQPFTGTLFLR